MARSGKAVGVVIFGRVARTGDVDGSDGDFLVDMEEEVSRSDLGGLQFELPHLLGLDVNVVTQGSLEPRDTHILADAVSLCLVWQAASESMPSLLVAIRLRQLPLGTVERGPIEVPGRGLGQAGFHG